MAEYQLPDLNAWEKAFFRLFDWLACDRDRRTARLSDDNLEEYRVELYIDQTLVRSVGGNELPDVVAEAMEGMIVETDYMGGTPYEPSDEQNPA